MKHHFTKQRKEQELYRQQAIRQISLFRLFANQIIKNNFGLKGEPHSSVRYKNDNNRFIHQFYIFLIITR